MDDRPDAGAVSSTATGGRPADLDALSLTQALVDFEVANARVVDLTRRLTKLTEEQVRLRTENQQLHLRLGAAEAELSRIKGNVPFRVLHLANAARRRLRK
ncbi:MAG: hypothetical protein V9F82_10205 [Dermatophilaceae bacterium]